MTSPAPDTFRIPVSGGELEVGRWPGPPGSPTVVAAHGITANHRSFDLVARELAHEVTVVAPDLRGRGRSNEINGPFGITAHAADLVALLDHLDVAEATLLGHSMGAWVAAVTAVCHPGRVHAVVLVDGGVALPLPDGIDIDAVLLAVLGPSIARLSMTFDDPAAYRAFWQDHPAVGGAYWSDLIEAYVDHDLVGSPPHCRSSVSIDAVRGDATEQLTVPAVRDAIESLPCPAHLLFAPRGLLDGDPLYAAETLDAVRGRWPTVVDELIVPDTNHFTIVLGAGAPAVAAAVRRATSG